MLKISRTRQVRRLWARDSSNLQTLSKSLIMSTPCNITLTKQLTFLSRCELEIPVNSRRKYHMFCYEHFADNIFFDINKNIKSPFMSRAHITHGLNITLYVLFIDSI